MTLIGEAPEPGELHIAVLEHLDRCLIVARRHILDLDAELLRQVRDQRRQLLADLGGVLIGDGGEAQHMRPSYRGRLFRSRLPSGTAQKRHQADEKDR